MKLIAIPIVTAVLTFVGLLSDYSWAITSIRAVLTTFKEKIHTVSRPINSTRRVDKLSGWSTFAHEVRQYLVEADQISHSRRGWLQLGHLLLVTGYKY